MSDISIPTGAMMALYNLKKSMLILSARKMKFQRAALSMDQKTIVRFGRKPKR